ncbi:MAG: PaaI family thioesterase [Chloracidobacterium sp.]|nr:PaaI family thioesterase [Chloracidobacterium sp.]
MAGMIDQMKRWQTGEAPPPPIAQLIGFRLVTVEPGEAIIEFEAGESHANPMGTLHGGVLCDVSDAAMGIAFASTLDNGESFTTLELKINFLKPIWKARLKATGRVIKRGRVIGLLECDLTDEGGSLVARASSTCMILRGEQAQGR